MSIRNFFKNKKVYINIKNTFLKEKVLKFLDKVQAKQSESLEKSNIIITDTNCKTSKCVKVGSIFSLDFIFSLKNLPNIGFYKDIYFLFSEPVFINAYDKMYFYAFIFIIFFLPLIFFPVPPDDLLRHIVSYRYDYDYSKVFINTQMPSWNFYLLYDFIVGKIHQFFYSLPLYEYLASWFGIDVYYFKNIVPLIIVYYIFVALIIYAVKVNVGKIPYTYLLLFISLFLIVSDSRMFLERPSTLATILFFISLGCFFNKREKLGVLFSFFISIFYYLFFIYLIPLLFHNRKVLYPLIFGVVYWNIIAYLGGGNYFFDIYQYILSLENATIMAGENKSIISAFSNFLFLGFVLVSILHYKSVDKKYFFTSFWFLLSNQVRYLENVGPLILFSIKGLILKFIQFTFKGSYLAVFLFSLSLYIVSYHLVYDNKIIIEKELCKTIEKHKIKTDLDLNFSLVYFCPNINVNPAMEIRWSKDKDIDEKFFLEKKIDCNEERLYYYDYLFEKSLIGKYDCLEFVYRNGKATLWKIVPTKEK